MDLHQEIIQIRETIVRLYNSRRDWFRLKGFFEADDFIHKLIETCLETKGLQKFLKEGRDPKPYLVQIIKNYIADASNQEKIFVDGEGLKYEAHKDKKDFRPHKVREICEEFQKYLEKVAPDLVEMFDRFRKGEFSIQICAGNKKAFFAKRTKLFTLFRNFRSGGRNLLEIYHEIYGTEDQEWVLGSEAEEILKDVLNEMEVTGQPGNRGALIYYWASKKKFLTKKEGRRFLIEKNSLLSFKRQLKLRLLKKGAKLTKEDV